MNDDPLLATPLGRRLAALDVRASSPDGGVNARLIGDRVVVTLTAQEIDKVARVGVGAVEAALSRVCTGLARARAEARSTAIRRALDPDPVPRSARDLESRRRLDALAVEGSAVSGRVVVGLVGTRLVSVVLDPGVPAEAIGPGVSAAMTDALAERKVASYRLRCELWGRSAESVS